MNLPLTARQEMLWRFIASCKRSPSYDEMAKALGYACRGQRIVDMVDALERKGFVRRVAKGARNVVALDHCVELAAIPTNRLADELARRLR